MAWTPQEGGLQEVLQVIKDSSQTDTAVQQATTLVRTIALVLWLEPAPNPSLFQRLQTFSQIPDYACYLAYILTYMHQEEERIRSVAGLLLKNHAVVSLGKWAPPVLQYVKASVAAAFNDQAVIVRNAAGQGIVAILGLVGPAAWPEILQQLLQLLDAPTIDLQVVRHVP